MQVYIEVSKNHNIPIGQVIKNKFTPETRLLIMYYNNKFHHEQKEYQKIEKQQKEVNKHGHK